jgi:hypothetical protein
MTAEAEHSNTVWFLPFHELQAMNRKTKSRHGLVPPKLLKNALYKKKIFCHIKLAIHAWSTKCR